ncbi:MAG: TM2 domain-containing protein [Lachnospiraceae bacterium]|nr:TM2 domain-containing protein [Lachnospiraceae bacterium]
MTGNRNQGPEGSHQGAYQQARDPYGQNPYGQQSRGQNSYGQDPYGRQSWGRDPYGQNPYGQQSRGQDPYGQGYYGAPYGEDPYVRRYGQQPVSTRQKWVAFILCFFFGTFGVHRFYVGKNGTGLLWLFTLGFFGVGWLVDLLMILTNSFNDNHGFPLKE